MAMKNESYLTLVIPAQRRSSMTSLTPSAESDRKILRNLVGITPVLPRSLSSFENFLSSIGSLYAIGGIQSLLKAALNEGGSAPTVWNWIVSSFITVMISASLAEICCLYPVAGSVYFWAGKTGGPRYGPVMSWFAALFNVCAWTLIAVADALAAANFIISEPVIYGNQFPNASQSVELRSIEFGLAAVILTLAAVINGLPHKYIGYVVKITALLMITLYLSNMIWLPIAVSRTYGFHSSKYVFTSVNNGNGASITYNWFINFLFPMYSLLGFDAASHFAEETKHAKVASPQAMFGSSLSSTILSFPLVLIFLYSDPTNEMLGAIKGSLAQPITAMYYFALGKEGHTFIVALSILLYFLNTILAVMTASRSIFAYARDGLVPKAVGKVNENGEPINAIWFVYAGAIVLLITVIPSNVAYNSVCSAAVMNLCASYALVLFGRLFLTNHEFTQGIWNLGKYSYAFGSIGFVWCCFSITVLCLPQAYPVIHSTLNYAPLIFAIVISIGVIGWFYSGKYWFDGPTIDEYPFQDYHPRGNIPGSPVLKDFPMIVVSLDTVTKANMEKVEITRLGTLFDAAEDEITVVK